MGLGGPILRGWGSPIIIACYSTEPEQEKMRSVLVAQFMPTSWLIARILMFRDKKYRILTFCDKTELYLTVLQQNNVEACLRCKASLSFVPSLPNAQLQLICRLCCASL